MMDHVNACLFGTFLADNLAERRSADLRSRTSSYWTHLFFSAQSPACPFLNPGFAPTTAVLAPKFELTDLVLFAPYFARWFAASPPGGDYLAPVSIKRP